MVYGIVRQHTPLNCDYNLNKVSFTINPINKFILMCTIGSVKTVGAIAAQLHFSSFHSERNKWPKLGFSSHDCYKCLQWVEQQCHHPLLIQHSVGQGSHQTAMSDYSAGLVSRESQSISELAWTSCLVVCLDKEVCVSESNKLILGVLSSHRGR